MNPTIFRVPPGIAVTLLYFFGTATTPHRVPAWAMWRQRRPGRAVSSPSAWITVHYALG